MVPFFRGIKIIIWIY